MELETPDPQVVVDFLKSTSMEFPVHESMPGVFR
jgi:hypothetical protein